MFGLLITKQRTFLSIQPHVMRKIMKWILFQRTSATYLECGAEKVFSFSLASFYVLVIKNVTIKTHF